jgi:hypothetical protein
LKLGFKNLNKVFFNTTGVEGEVHIADDEVNTREADSETEEVLLVTQASKSRRAEQLVVEVGC